MEMINVKLDKGGKINSTEKMLRPTTFVCWLLGVGVSRPLNCPKVATKILRLVHFTICSVIVAYGAKDFFFFGSVFKSDTYRIMYYTNKVACYLSSYYYVSHGLHHYGKWPGIIERLSKIDKKLKSLGLKDSGRSLKICQFIALFVTLVLGPLSLISHGVYYHLIRPKDIFASDLLLYYTMAQSLSVNFSFDLIVFAIYDRYKAVNRAIARIDEGYTAVLIILEVRRARELHHGSLEQDIGIILDTLANSRLIVTLETLWFPAINHKPLFVCFYSIMFYFIYFFNVMTNFGAAISQLIRFLNGVHGIHLLLSSINSFTMVVATLFRIYMGVVEKRYDFMLINNVIWITYAAQFALTCCVCTKACKESSKTAVLVHDIVLSRVPKARPPCDLYALDMARVSYDSEISLRHEINDFSAQLQQRDVAFTACDFFDMNNSLLRSFVGVITTYLIILVQFYQPEVKEQEEAFTTLRPEAIEI